LDVPRCEAPGVVGGVWQGPNADKEGDGAKHADGYERVSGLILSA